MTKSPKTWPLAEEREFWRSACAPGTSPDSLWWFVRIAWGTEWYFRKTGKTRWLVARVHKPFLRWYQAHILEWFERRRRGVIGRTYLLVLVFRNAGKTLLITQAANLWAHLHDRNLSWYIGSETHPKAQTFLESIKEVMQGSGESSEFSWFTWLYGNFRQKGRMWAAEGVKTAYRSATVIKEPTFGTYGLEMGITGMHPDGVTFDDPHSLETLSVLQLQAARDSYDATHPALRTDSIFVGVMTRYAGNDAAGHILSQEGIASWTGLPCDDPLHAAAIGKGKVHVYFLQGRDKTNTSDEHPKGAPVLPEVWDKDGMDHYQEKDPVNFAAQIMNNPTTGEHMPLEYAQLNLMEVSRENVPDIDFATIHLDTAFKDEERIGRGDYNVIAGVLHSFGTRKVFIDRIIRNKTDDASKFISRLCAYMLSLENRGYRLKVITDESEAMGKKGTFKQLVLVSLAIAGFRIGPDMFKTFNRTNKKPVRLRKAAAFWAEGHVRIIRGIEEIDRLKYEMVNLDKGDHDDITDALSDIWQEDVWVKPHKHESQYSGPVIQPGDDILRPGLLSEADRLARRAEYDPRYQGERQYRDDPV